MKNLKINCSLTLEASLVMITVLITIGTFLAVSMSVYDKVLSRCVLLETMELHSHRYEDGDYLSNEARLQNCMLSDDGKITVTVDEITKKATGRVDAGAISFEDERLDIRPEKFMRAVTLTKFLEAGEK